jgi:hypothetical protein
MIRLLCFEPAGQVVTLDEDDLTRHVLGLGATGCGKTTGLVNRVLQQTIAWRASDLGRKPGLLVLDPKEDDTPQKVEAYARESGRLEDVTILSAGGDAYYGYFADFRRLQQVDDFTRRVLYGSRDMGEENAYWTESRYGLVSSALTVLLAVSPFPTFDRVVEFLRSWFYGQDSDLIKQSLHFVERVLGSSDLKAATRRRLELAIAEAQNWKALDARTRELHKSTLNNALRALLSPTGRDIFDETRPYRFDPKDVLRGKILVASVNAVTHPELTGLLFKALKRDYCEAVLSRVAFDPQVERLCGLILDELPLSVTSEDVESLAVLRSKGGFVVACAQGLSGLDDVLGPRRRAALLSNFNSVFYFSSRESQTDEHAMLSLGLDDSPSDHATSKQEGSLLEPFPSAPPRLVCSPGSLARLPQHHAFVKLASGVVTKLPVWLEPKFHNFPPPKRPNEEDDLAKAADSVRSADQDDDNRAGVAAFLLHMHRRGHPLKLSPNVVAAAWQLCRPRLELSRVFTQLSPGIAGLETLPPCWLMGLGQWLRKNSSHPSAITQVSVCSGVLWADLDAVSNSCREAPRLVSEAINLFIYPSLWRPLLSRHLRELRLDRPDLRGELESLTKAAANAAF